MKVMLVKDVYKLGRAGDVKKVADGYGRNFLVPQGLAVLATAGALKQMEKIRSQAEIRRTEQNSELQGLADQIKGVVVYLCRQGWRYGQTLWLHHHTGCSNRHFRTDPLRSQEAAG